VEPAGCIASMARPLVRASPMAMMMVPIVVVVMVPVVVPVVPMMVMVPIMAIMGLLDEAQVAAVDTGIAHRHRCGLR
jgi:hypothetical protein